MADRKTTARAFGHSAAGTHVESPSGAHITAPARTYVLAPTGAYVLAASRSDITVSGPSAGAHELTLATPPSGGSSKDVR